MDPPRPTTAKLRLMCSYGGQILPRPRTNTLFYAGGDTRIVSMDRRTVTTLSALISHLSSVLSLNFPFTLKYLLPHLQLDSLISLASDEDFRILLDEHHRSSSSSSSRIRLFVFPSKIIGDSWFLDALNTTKIMQNADSPPDSTLVDTTSSLGSTSSSTSLSNLPPIRPLPDDSDSLPSDNSTVSNINISYQDPLLHHVPQVESSQIPYTYIVNNPNVDIAYSSFPQVQSPNFHFLQPPPTPSQYFLPLHPATTISAHQIYHQTPPLHHLVYHPNHLFPVYLVPVANMPLPPNALPITQAHNSQVGAIRSPYADGFASQSEEPEVDGYPMDRYQSQSQNASRESPPECGNEIDNELAHVQIYKSQPPPPALPSKYQTMTKASTNLLSQALARLHVNSLKPHTETESTPQPQ